MRKVSAKKNELFQGGAKEELELAIQQLTTELSQTRSQSSSHSHEISSLQSQAEAARAEAEQLREESEALGQQNGHLREDLNTMTQVRRVGEGVVALIAFVALIQRQSQRLASCSFIRMKGMLDLWLLHVVFGSLCLGLCDVFHL